jgi:hypothetical protein
MIIAKAIDIQSISATVLPSGSNNFIDLGYEEYLNFNTDTGTWDSRNTIVGFCNVNELSMNWAINVDTSRHDYVKVNMGGSALIFSNGEYNDLNGDYFEVGYIVVKITQALGL